MIIPGVEVQTRVRIIEDGLDIMPGQKGIVIDIVTDQITHKPMFVIDFYSCIMGAFLNEIEPVVSATKGEWV